MDCLAPELTITSPGSTAKPWALPIQAATALRRGAVPSTSVYLVAPASSAFLAASLMCAGVSKSGSPAPKLTTSTPAAFSFAALAETARVGDGSTTDNLRASFTVSLLVCVFRRAPRRRPRAPGPRRPRPSAPPLSRARRIHKSSPRWSSKHRLDVGRQPAVHVRRLELVFEVGQRAQPADDDRRPPP